MPLNLSTGDDFTPYLKYNAKAGRFYVRPQGVSEDVEVANPRLAVDMANIKTGWIYYAEGSGPEKIWDASQSQAAPRPPGPKKFKRGFEVFVVGGDEIRGVGRLGLREFSSTAVNVISAILRMHAEYEAGMAANSGKVPFYVCDRVKPVNGAYGTNYEPEFRLTGWVDRAKLPELDAAQDTPAHNGSGFAASDYAAASRGEPAPDQGNARGGSADFDDEIPF